MWLEYKTATCDCIYHKQRRTNGMRRESAWRSA
ncbi:hypothetical protein Z043_112786 [Scleropages formosus]|uniref:Uncharacterized protein n=1 Tax=Scleropages formosus TaxID=113540 RepID=A0A0P7WWQ0_SCLFO|nr:hypothetical protein Z043_112786 [Scleropages formosus]